MFEKKCLCSEELCNISLKYICHIWYLFETNLVHISNFSYIFKIKVIFGICFKQTFLCVEELNHISFKYKLYLIYVSNKLFFVLKNYIIYL